jgi:putative transposase
VLRIVGVSEQTYYFHRRRNPEKQREHNGGRPIPGYSLTNDQQPISDEQIKEWLLELVAGEGHAYGYRKLTVCLRRQRKLIINKKKVYRLCKELNILNPQRRIKFKHPRKLANNRIITGSNQLWETDIKYGYIAGEHRFFYLQSIIDVYDRSIVDYHLGLSCAGTDVAQILQRALLRRQLFDCPELPTIRTDNGPQFISHAFEQTCIALKLEHERIPPKTPNKNAHIESFHSILEKECLGKQEFSSYQEAYKAVINFIHFYNQNRIHGSLYDLAPKEFMNLIKQNMVKPFIVKV